MKKHFLIIVALLILHGLYAQTDSSARPANFAIVELSGSPDGRGHCTAKYDNGAKVGMDKAFGLPRYSEYLDRNEMDSAEFKILDHFYKNGYELLNISRTNYFARFYFKRKGI